MKKKDRCGYYAEGSLANKLPVVDDPGIVVVFGDTKELLFYLPLLSSWPERGMTFLSGIHSARRQQ